jgi:hypothetical protein
MATKNVRGYFFYRVLDEAQKAAISLMHWKEFMSDSGTKLKETPDTDQIFRIVLEETADAQNLRCRKLVEALVELVMFSSTDTEPYYRDYFLIRDLVDYVGYQKDRQDFFGFTNRNTASSIADFLVRIRENESQIDIKRRWYLENSKPAEDGWIAKPPSLTSFRTRYKAALRLFHETEYVAVGKSYTHAYGFSRSIHFSPQETNSSFSKADLVIDGNRCAILALAIISRCAHMLQKVDDPTIQQIAKLTTENEETKRLVRAASEQIASSGDYIGVGGDLGRVTDIFKSTYGFYSYEIEYISSAPLEEIPRDWFAGFEIRLLAKRTDLIARLKVELGAAYTEELIDQRIDAAVFELWKAHKNIVATLKPTPDQAEAPSDDS